MKSVVLFLLCLLPTLVVCQNPAFGVYSMTLDSPNMLSIFSGSATDGSITYVTQIPTGGNGAAVNQSGIQAQSSITVLQNYLFLVNPGSATVSMFAINPQNPTNLTLVGTPASSGGDWPNSVTAFGNYVCVVNTGANNGLRCFTFNATNGLTPIAGSDRSFGLNLTTPPISHMGPAQIAFTPSGNALIISIKGFNPPVYMYSFSNGVVGANPIQSTSNGAVNFGFTFDTDATIVLTDAAPYGNGSGIILLTATASNITFNTPNYFLIPSQSGVCWVVRSPSTTHFYVANTGTSTISELSRSANVLAVVNNYPVGNGSVPTDMTVVTLGTQDYLYINEVGASNITAMKLVSGNATIIGSIADHQGSHGAGIASFVATAAVTTGVSLTTGNAVTTGSGAITSGSLTTVMATTAKASSGYIIVPSIFMIIGVLLALLN